MQEQVGIRVDGLVGYSAHRVFARRVGGCVAQVATGLDEDLRAVGHLWVVHVSHGGHGKSLGVENDLGEALVGNLGTPAVGGYSAVLLGVRAVLLGEHSRGYADIAQEGAGGLLLHRRLIGFPTEAAQGKPSHPFVPDHVGPPRDAVAVGVVRVGRGQDDLLGDGFQQAHADHRRGHSR